MITRCSEDSCYFPAFPGISSLITNHVNDGNYEEAEKLAAIGEFLEDCLHWELFLFPEQLEGDYV